MVILWDSLLKENIGAGSDLIDLAIFSIGNKASNPGKISNKGRKD